MKKLLSFICLILLFQQYNGQQCEGEPMQVSSKIEKFKLPFNLPLSISENYCTQYEIPLNYKQAEILIKSSYITHYMISDKPINKCSEIHFTECPQDSVVCSRSLNHVEKLTKEKIGLCLDKVYVTVLIKCQPEEGDNIGSIETHMLNSQPCNAIKETDEIKCAKYNKQQCGNKDPELCNDDCFWVDCSVINQDNRNETVFGSCIPVENYKENEQKEACRADYQWAVVEQSDAKKSAANPKWCGGKAPSHLINDIIDKEKSMGVFGTILMFAVLLFLVFLCIVGAYRYEVSTGRPAPFTPPEFLAEQEWLFPQEHPQPQSITPLFRSRMQQSQVPQQLQQSGFNNSNINNQIEMDEVELKDTPQNLNQSQQQQQGQTLQ